MVLGALTLWAAVTIAFFALRLTAGDPTASLLSQGLATAQQAEALRRALGLDRPLVAQYVAYVAGAVRGDLGRSLYTQRPVTTVIAEQSGSTLRLATAGLVTAAVFGTMLGVLAGWGGTSLLGRAAGALAGIATAVPVAVTGVVILWVATWAGGLSPPLLVLTRGSNLTLPALTLGLASSGALARVIQSGLEDNLRSTYLLAARARGVGHGLRLMWHAFRPALPSAISFLALETALLLSGTVVTETVFARPGLGRLLVSSILAGDFPVVQGLVLLAATIYTSTHILADAVSAFADPRLRAAG